MLIVHQWQGLGAEQTFRHQRKYGIFVDTTCCGSGGPARYLASTFGCAVIGVDLSPSFIEVAEYLTLRCSLGDRVTFKVGDALHLPFDALFLQYVAMNIADRAALYAEVRWVLKQGGTFATYDLVSTGSEVSYPAPWARDDTKTAPDWFKAASANRPSSLNRGVVMGAEFPAITGNLGRNIHEGRLGVLSAVLTCA